MILRDCDKAESANARCKADKSEEIMCMETTFHGEADQRLRKSPTESRLYINFVGKLEISIREM